MSNHKATLNGVPLTETANSPIFTVYRGADFNLGNT